MIGLPLIFLGGLLGSAHCVGMCGGLRAVDRFGRARRPATSARQLVYSSGRIFTYAAIGAAVGYAGLRLAVDAPAVVHVQAVLAIAAGVLLVVHGLAAAGVVARVKAKSSAAWAQFRRPQAQLALPVLGQHTGGGGCLATSSLAAFLRSPGWGSVFLAGMLTGFLPCGLVYAYLALAASAADFVDGMLTMAAFGLGTVPLMVATGSGAVAAVAGQPSTALPAGRLVRRAHRPVVDGARLLVPGPERISRRRCLSHVSVTRQARPESVSTPGPILS